MVRRKCSPDPDALNPLSGWSWGAYFHEAGQFGIGEGKGFVNFAAGSVVYGSPELSLIDAQTGGHLGSPLAASNESQSNGAGTAEGIATVASFFTGEGEAAAVEGGAAKIFAGAESKIASTGCFLAGTPVQMADGTTKPIERVREGDYVKSRDPKTGMTEARRVLQTTVRQTGAVLTLSLVDPQTGRVEAITTTGEHPFYVDGKGFVQAGDLGIGTSIVTRAGPALTLSQRAWQTGRAPGGSLLSSKPGSFTVYNLIVTGDHTYFVGTAGGGAWVHNVDCTLPRAYNVPEVPGPGPSEAFNRDYHYGRTPNAAQKASLPDPQTQVFDHDPPLGVHYYYGDGKGGVPGYMMTQAERESYGGSLSSGRPGLRSDMKPQGGRVKGFTERVRKSLGLPRFGRPRRIRRGL